MIGYTSGMVKKGDNMTTTTKRQALAASLGDRFTEEQRHTDEVWYISKHRAALTSGTNAGQWARIVIDENGGIEFYAFDGNALDFQFTIDCNAPVNMTTAMLTTATKHIDAR